MGRQYDQEHFFKVAGRTISNADQASASKALLTHEKADLRKIAHTQPQMPLHSMKSIGVKAMGGRLPHARPPTPVRAKPVPRATATVRKIHPEKLIHGKKRRSSQKRHEVEVHEMEMHRRQPAEVIDLRTEQAPRPDQMPDSLPDVIVTVRRYVLRRVAEAVHTLAELLAVPLTALDMIREIRRREA